MASTATNLSMAIEAIEDAIKEQIELRTVLLGLLEPHNHSSDQDLAHNFGVSFEAIRDARNVAEKYR